MKLRVARHTNKIDEITEFYTEIIGLEIIGQFSNHENYDGIFFGKSGLNWHFEFTTSGTITKHIPDEDDLIVFYPESEMEYESILQRIKIYNIKFDNPKNPYWRENGVLIKDPDKFGVIISHVKSSTTANTR